MTVLHTGSTKKFAAGWENVFAGQGGRAARPSTETASEKGAAGKRQATAKKRLSTARKNKRRK